MKFAIGCDHGGFALKEHLSAHLRELGHELEDMGTFSEESTDYPDFAAAVCRAVTRGQADQGLLICRTGMGMSIASNKFPAIRAALCLTPDMVNLARQHNDANVMVLGADILESASAEGLLDAWLKTPGPEEPRHHRRVGKMRTLAAEALEVDQFWPQDPELFDAIGLERIRQDENLELIASENYASPAVRAAQGGVMTNKYAEGYPGKRWYNGCEHVDTAERLAIARVKELFGAEHANVQPHCGSSANMAVYFSVLQPGDTILAMSLDQGGHLTHGHPMNFSGRLFNIVPYGVDRETERIDYNEVRKLAEAHRPKLLCAGASAYSREFDFLRLREICDAVGAYLMVDMAHIAGLVAGGAHSSPVPHADFVTSTTHKTLRGPRGGIVLCRQTYAADIDKQVFPGLQGGPLMHVIAAKAVAFGEALRPEFKAYARQVVANAQVLAEALAGLGFRIVSGGTDNHLMLVDVSARKLTGKAAATVLDVAGITVNKNAIPFDTKSPFVTSGIRIGTPAVTTRGMGEPEMKAIAALIGQVLERPDDPDFARETKAQVRALPRSFPLP